MSIALVSANTELNAKIEEFVKAADEVTAEYWTRTGLTYAPPSTHEAQYISDKWVKVVTVEHQHDGTKRVGSVYAFIVLQDNETKTLGKLKAGDIHKAATYKAPAKHARGNVFNADFRKALTAHGIVYLK